MIFKLNYNYKSRLFIPGIGIILHWLAIGHLNYILKEEIKVLLQNTIFFQKKDGWDKKNEIDGKYYLVTQEAGTVFSTNRLYVKQGQKDFESITLLAQNGNKKGRFWVKLEDINNAIIMPWK